MPTIHKFFQGSHCSGFRLFSTGMLYFSDTIPKLELTSKVAIVRCDARSNNSAHFIVITRKYELLSQLTTCIKKHLMYEHLISFPKLNWHWKCPPTFLTLLKIRKGINVLYILQSTLAEADPGSVKRGGGNPNSSMSRPKITKIGQKKKKSAQKRGGRGRFGPPLDPPLLWHS